METIELNSRNIIEGFNEIINAKRECAVYGIPDGHFVFKGTSDLINLEYCEGHQINLLQIPNEGGVIVLSEGDFEIGIFKYNGWDIHTDLIEFFQRELSKTIQNIIVLDNDLIVDDIYKVAGLSSRHLGNNYVYTAMHISVNVDLDLINNICTKEMKKIPKGLSDYGITTDYIKELYLQFTQTI